MCFRALLPVHVLTPILIVLVVPLSTARAQAGLFDEYTVQPEVWHFAVPTMPGVDGQGNLNLSIPVMTVPGRGIDFEIAFSYRSSISAMQRSSWIGLGWSFDPGSITREPGGGAVPMNADLDRYVGYGVDVFDDPANLPTLPDNYYLTLPGRGTVEATQINDAGYDKPDLLPAAMEGDFITGDFRPWRIEAFMSSGAIDLGGDCSDHSAGCPTGFTPPAYDFEEHADIERFVVTTEDGTRYVFEAPTLAFFDHYQRQGDEHYGIARQVYVSAWRLVAILGPSYQGNSLPTAGDAGSWISLKYGTVLYDDLSSGIRGVAKFAQTRFLQRIITPTHCAVFAVDQRRGPFFEDHENQIQRHLSRITLYDAPGCSAGGHAVKQVLLEQSKNTHGHSPEKNYPNGYRRLRLDGITFKGAGGQLRGGAYTFEYDASASDLIADPADLENNTDHFGFYSRDFLVAPIDTEHGGAWSLTKISYPTGGRVEISYETDRVSSLDRVKYLGFLGAHYYDFGEAAYLQYQGGGRVTEIRRDDGMGHDEVIRFTYGEGHSSGVPPLYWHRIRHHGNVRLYTPSNRGRVGVFYEWVEKEILPDGGATKTYYTTSGSELWANPIQTYEYHDAYPNLQPSPYCAVEQNCHIYTVIHDNRDWNWGRPYRIEHLNSNGSVVKRIEQDRTLQYYGGIARIWEAPSCEDYEGCKRNYPLTLSVKFGKSHVEAKEIYERGILIQRENYTYDARTNLRKTKEVRDGGGVLLRKQTTSFAHDRYSGMRAANMLGPSFATTVTDAQGDVRSKRWTTWRNTSYGFWVPSKEWAWTGTDGTAPADPGGAETLRLKTYSIYNAHGFLTRSTDARGHQTTLTYNGSGLLTRVQKAGLSVRYGYNARGLLSRLTDENGQSRCYDYDAFGRLSKVRFIGHRTDCSYTGTLLERYAYHYSTGDPGADPSYVRTIRYGPTNEVMKTFVDGLGRKVQTRTEAGGGQAVVTRTDYDEQGRSSKTWRPISVGGN